MASRVVGELTFQDVSRQLHATSILCLPLGSMEQHGPHLPLNTDAVIAEAFTRREIARALPAKNLAIINGHGGNRGILEALARELAGDFGLNLCALHLGAMMSPVADGPVPEIHGGLD